MPVFITIFACHFVAPEFAPQLIFEISTFQLVAADRKFIFLDLLLLFLVIFCYYSDFNGNILNSEYKEGPVDDLTNLRNKIWSIEY